ncbi:hypothetical protein Dimus_026143 [Dionaea muscipula]
MCHIGAYVYIFPWLIPDKILTSENKQLTEEMKDMAINVVIEVRGTLIKEFRDGETSKWDVEGDIKLMEELAASSSPQAETVGQDGGDDDLGASNLSPLSKD